MRKIRCVIMRGGTSKAVVLHEQDLPANLDERKDVILKIFGSPDMRQIDGLGGADPLTSKCAVIGRSDSADADITYSFYQVGIDKPIVEPGICGNISTVCAPFAIDEGLVEAVEPITSVRIYNKDAKKILYAEVPVVNSKAATEGDYKIDGVPGTGAKVTLDWREIVGTITGKLLPTGNTKDKLNVEGVGDLIVSIVDGGTPVAFVNAEELGLKGTESAREIDSESYLLARLEVIRGTVAERVKLIKDWRRSLEDSPVMPMVAFVNKPAPYVAFSGEKIDSGDVDLVARLIFMQKLHKAYPGSGSICTGIAAMMEGTVVNDIVSKRIMTDNNVRIGHPGGVMEVESAVRKDGDSFVVERSRVGRTARRIMDGFVYIR
jgi:2-methylaconitate cis-trans-isomerase PrpF